MRDDQSDSSECFRLAGDGSCRARVSVKIVTDENKGSTVLVLCRVLPYVPGRS